MLNIHELLRLTLRGFPSIFVSLLCAHLAVAQDRYVDAQCGSNFNDGLTPATAWHSVDFALNGPQAPLPMNTTLHLLGTNGLAYSAASGESFPWVLYNNISLVADAGLTGCGANPVDHIVSGSGTAPALITYSATQDCAGCVIRGLTCTSASTGILIAPSSAAQSPTIEDCTFQQVGNPVRIAPLAGNLPSVAPLIRNCTMSDGYVGIVANAGGNVSPIIRANTFLSSGLQLSGGPNIGTPVIDANTFSGSGFLDSISIAFYQGPVRCTNNIITASSSYNSYAGIVIRECNPWSADSLVAGNSCTPSGPSPLRDGIRVAGTNGVILASNTIANNAAGVRITSGTYSYGCSGVQLIDNTISDNQGVGIKDDLCQSTHVRRNLVTRNASHGIQLVATSTTAPPSIENNTIVDNVGNGINTSLSSTTPMYVSNCILWGNATGGCDIAGLSIGQYRYCDIGTCASPGNGNISANPQFVDPTNLDYHLQPTSPCIDSGDPAAAADCDGTRSDVGAFPHAICTTVLCVGDGSLVPCPCGNNGAPGNGCANSAFGGGANLSANGTASVATDSLTLSASNMTGAVAIFFQGATTTTPTIIDDGLGCVGGPIIRLGNKAVVANASSYPQAGDVSISVRGAIPGAGGTRYYQCFYRNAASAFCPPATSNRTNGVAESWTP